MPRMARKISNTRIYHIILRGNDKQDIFFDKQDYVKFINEVVKAKEKYQYDLYAYCLMTNHVHLVIYDKENKISKIMQSISIAYSSYFSKKYEKVGHLFQNRFLSKSIENKKYLLEVVRYIHQNPTKAKIANTDKYKWSSYQEYIYTDKIINSKLILSMFGNTKQEAIKNFVFFHRYKEERLNDDIEYEMIQKLTDNELKEKIEKLLEIEDVRDIRKYNAKIRNEKLKQLKEIRGNTKVQLSRVLGINKKMLERVMK